MKNRISINSVIINQYSIEVCYLIEGDCCKYFNIEKGNSFRIEYNENIERVPKNIAVDVYKRQEVARLWPSP